MTETEKWKAEEEAISLVEKLIETHHWFPNSDVSLSRGMEEMRTVLSAAYAAGHRDGYRDGKWNEKNPAAPE